MAAPFLTGNVYYQQDVGVTDVQTIINNLTTLALAATPAWTSPVAGTLVSPVDASGRQFTIVLSRIAAGTLQMVATDGQSRSVTRRANITTTTINYYVGQFHMVLDFSNGEGLSAIMLDESPEVQTSHNMWLIVQGTRNAGGGADNGWIFGSYFPIRNGNVFTLINNAFLVPMYNAVLNGFSNGIATRTLGGSNIWIPCIAMGDASGASLFNIYGKLYQCLGTKDTYVAADSEVSVPIDNANSVIFRMLNQGAWAPAGINYHDRMAVRKT